MFRAEPLRADAFRITFDDVQRVMIPNAFDRCGESLVEGRCCRQRGGSVALTHAAADAA